MTQKQEESDTDTFSAGDLVVNPDDLLPPVLKLEKYATSDIVFNRQIVARNLLDTLRVVVGNADEVARVVSILCNLAEDYEPSVRAELMQQVPHIASFFSEYDYQLGHLIQQYIVPMLINHLNDINAQTRKTSQASLLLMVEQNLIDNVALESKICPRILQQTESSYMDDLRTEAVMLMSKLSPLIGKDATERLFLDRFLNLCLDSSFHVRKVCAENFGEICTIVERETTEKQLLPKFYFLCEDSVWGVRKVCAEVFMPVSCVCSMETRHKDLAPVYMNLLCDQSKWVRMAAFQALGPFISTFAEPSKTGLYYNKEGTLTVVDMPCDEVKKDGSCDEKKDRSCDVENESDCKLNAHVSADVSEGETNPSSNLCDSVVPSLKSDKISDSYTQSTMCHLGKYRTVIELNSSNCNLRDVKTSISNGCHDSKYVNCDHNADNVTNDIGKTDDCVESSDISILSSSSKEIEMCSHSKKDASCNLCDSDGQSPLGEVKVLKTEVCNGEISDHVLAADLDNYLESRLLNMEESLVSNSSFSSIIVVGKSVPNESVVNGYPDSFVMDSKQMLSSLSSLLSRAPDALVQAERDFIAREFGSTTLPERSLSDDNEIRDDNEAPNHETTNSTEWLSQDEQVAVCEDNVPSGDWIPSCREKFDDQVPSECSEQVSGAREASHPFAVDEISAEEEITCNDSFDICQNSEEFVTDADDYSIPECESAFNDFQYWRMPLPTVDVDAIPEEIQCSGSANCTDPASDKCKRNKRSCLISQHYVSSSNFNSADADMQSVGTESSSETVTGPSNQANVNIASLTTCSLCGSLFDENREHSLDDAADNPVKTKANDQSSSDDSKMNNSSLCNAPSKEFNNLTDVKEGSLSMQNLFSAHDQDIVPPELLLRYLSMTDASRAQSVDAEIARHCAYSLPAVALTLGRRFWPCLKETYNTLASDMQGFIMQWKVRRTLASSMHQLAVILGPDIAARDLLPIFSGFIKDLDEVRIGILQHLAEFLAVLRVKQRQEYLPRLSEFLNTDNNRNWRFRHILSEQLIQIAELYEPNDVREYLVPLALALVKDKVSEVRMVAVRVMAVMIKQMNSNPELTKEVLQELAEMFIHAPKWLHRQIYVYLCQEFIKQNSLPADQFAEDALPHLLFLCWDRVANVRLAIARCLAVFVWPSAAFSDPKSPHSELVLQAIHPLQSDIDADVRYFANMVATDECSCLQHSSLDLDNQAV